MFTIDLILKFTPLPISVQRKEAQDADALYQKISTAMRSRDPEVIELTCEKQPEKKVSIVSDQISAVIVSQKDANATGRVPGFFSTLES